MLADMTPILKTLGLAAIAVSVAAALPAHAPATTTETLARAEQIRADADARYPSLAVTEASTTSVVDSLVLLGSAHEQRVVSAENGVYFAICSERARCPYPGSAAWSPNARVPRRLARELALRTLHETAADLVVVSLPTARPVLLVVERGVDTQRLFVPFALVPVSETRDTLVLAPV
jgi:hypothetical protein